MSGPIHTPLSRITPERPALPAIIGGHDLVDIFFTRSQRRWPHPSVSAADKNTERPETRRPISGQNLVDDIISMGPGDAGMGATLPGPLRNFRRWDVCDAGIRKPKTSTKFCPPVIALMASFRAGGGKKNYMLINHYGSSRRRSARRIKHENAVFSLNNSAKLNTKSPIWVVG